MDVRHFETTHTAKSIRCQVSYNWAESANESEVTLAANWMECTEEEEPVEDEEYNPEVESPDVVGDTVIEIIDIDLSGWVDYI